MYKYIKNINIVKIIKNMNYGTYTEYKIKNRAFFFLLFGFLKFSLFQNYKNITKQNTYKNMNCGTYTEC